MEPLKIIQTTVLDMVKEYCVHSYFTSTPFMTQPKGDIETEHSFRILIPSKRSISTNDSAALARLLSSGSNSTLLWIDTMG